ncbi:uncharacterized protein LOC129981462 [Argiope bruennichi]|uniref:Uncharacterized protein n=1 Tax=Argiope bruennichi TaxID=94029 RepID=A0A8T0G445_ARGBR|nr:uncharacterized protein LOC129981462 [Argiope bruennichi]KAF8797248.1 hypothetical protein HNY73_001533 [Argiope bruennichi]
MFRGSLILQALFLLYCIGSGIAWSHKKHKNATQPGYKQELSTSAPAHISIENSPSFEEAHESKPKPRFAAAGHSSGGDQYILEEDEGHVVGEDDGEFIDEEGKEEEYGQEQERGYHNDDKKVDDETQKDFKQTGAYQDFSQGGAVFDKHHKDRQAENKENEDVKQHDAGEKFGAEALKEHKLGKHKEKSKGHKKYGFKNVYHKEEYGDHKTFHDEFLDNDHFHDYDDKHEHKQMQGGRFTKGYKRSGENKEHDVGDEKHAWGKAGHDGHAEGYYEKGGHLSGHHHGHKKQEGHYDANARHGKQSAHKLRKGEVPVVSSVYHQGDDKPQYYSQVHHAQDDPAHLHTEAIIPEHHYGGYHARHNGAQPAEVKPVKPVKEYADRELPPVPVLQYHERRSPGDARRLEVIGDKTYSARDLEQIQQPIKDIQPIREIVPPKETHRLQSYQYMQPENDQSFSKEDRISKYRQQYGLSEPRKSYLHQRTLPALQSSKPDLPIQHSHPIHRANQQVPRNHHSNENLPQYQTRNHGHRHFLISPNNQQDSRSNQHHQTDDQGHSKSYPWWEASNAARKHHQSRDFKPSPSYQHYGYVEVPEHEAPWRQRQHHLMEEYEPAASQQRPGYIRQPKKVQWKRVKNHRHS